MKTIKINESQRKRLFEAYSDGFSFENLTMIGVGFGNNDGSETQYRYCCKYLGKPDGHGTSRCVFTLDDKTVLKLAYGMRDAGIAQNKREYNLSLRNGSPLFARIYGHDSRFTYLVAEAVLPAREEDFERILGIPYYMKFKQNSVREKDPHSKNGGDADIGFNKYFDNIREPGEFQEDGLCAFDILTYISDRYASKKRIREKSYDSFINSSPWLTSLVRLVKRSNVCDIRKMENYGIVNRNGQEELVLLDSGFTTKIHKQYYW